MEIPKNNHAMISCMYATNKNLWIIAIIIYDKIIIKLKIMIIAIIIIF